VDLARRARPAAGRLISRNYPAILAGCLPNARGGRFDAGRRVPNRRSTSARNKRDDRLAKGHERLGWDGHGVAYDLEPCAFPGHCHCLIFCCGPTLWRNVASSGIAVWHATALRHYPVSAQVDLRTKHLQCVDQDLQDY
jgi:hypothetical protein